MFPPQIAEFLGSYQLKVTLLILIVVFVLARYLVIKYELGRVKIAVTVLVALTCVVSWFSFNSHGVPWKERFLNNHDTYHYYFGAKYSAEIPYERLYHCTVVALDEIDPRLHKRAKTLRSMNHYRHVNKQWYLDRPNTCKKNFSKQRWSEFKTDLKRFKKGRRVGWKRYLSDKGYNATPVWNMTGRFFAHTISLDSWQEFNLIGSLDLILIILAMGVSFFAFGWWGPGIGLIYLGAHYALTTGFIRGSFLRMDWLALLIFAMAAIKKDHYKLAGGLIAYAAMVRAFPMLFLFGPGIGAVRAIVKERRLPKRYWQLFGSFLIVCGLLFGMSVIHDGGMDKWKHWTKKIELHNADISTMRIGLGPALMYRGETTKADHRSPDGKKGWRSYFVPTKQAVVKQMLPVHIIVASLVLFALAWGLWGREDVESMAFSFPVVFVMVSPTFYYYCLLLPTILGLAHYAQKNRTAMITLAMLAVANIGFHSSHRWVELEYQKYTIFSYILAPVVVVTLLMLILERRHKKA